MGLDTRPRRKPPRRPALPPHNPEIARVNENDFFLAECRLLQQQRCIGGHSRGCENECREQSALNLGGH